VTAAGEAEKLLPAMTGVGQSNNESHDTVNWIRKSIERVHAPRMMTSTFAVKLTAGKKMGNGSAQNYFP
jgi:hypothetical protein